MNRLKRHAYFSMFDSQKVRQLDPKYSERFHVRMQNLPVITKPRAQLSEHFIGRNHNQSVVKLDLTGRTQVT